MAIVGISGPSFSGKTTLARLLSSSLPIDAVVLPDFYETVYNELLESRVFQTFQEIQKDRDYLLTYVGRVVKFYEEMLDAYREYPGLVVCDGTHLDILIYSMLSLWYHYPAREVQEQLMQRVLALKDRVSVIYMTIADDDNYPILSWDRRRYNTSFFRKCRKTELMYYDVFRDNCNVITLPSSAISTCEHFIIEDLKSRGLIT